MPDIFISYSRKDSQSADRLERMLTAAGFSCWIDRAGIDVATSWSGEIVDAIEECKAFVVLLSSNSIASHNVIKEVSLAAEERKKILPLDVEDVDLPREMKYHLAGIQRAPLANFDAIVRALGKLGIDVPAGPQTVTKVAVPTAKKESSGRKSLMILPFEDLSPAADNQWFADGIVSELIAALSNVKALKLADSQATKEFKHYRGQLSTYAQEMQIRYFVQGDVRKFGDQIKVSSRLLDIDSGDHLWQDSLKGTMNDIFDIQEKVAEKVVEGLKIHLASDEKKKLAERGTDNAEAYELLLKGDEYFARQTKESFQIALKLYSEAIALDPGYAQAYTCKAVALANFYRNYHRDPAQLDEGMNLIREAMRLKPNLWRSYKALSQILRLQGKLTEAEEAAKEFVRNAPEDYLSHGTLGFFYNTTGEFTKAIAPFERELELKSDDLNALFSLVICCNGAQEFERRKRWAETAIPMFEKHLKIFPDDENRRVHHAALLHFADRDDEARQAARKLGDLRDGITLYNTACLQCDLADYEAGLKTFRKAMDAGYRDVRHLRNFLSDEKEGVLVLQGTPDYEEVKQMVEKIS